MRVLLSRRAKRRLSRAPGHVRSVVISFVVDLEGSPGPMPNGWDAIRVRGSDNRFRVRVGKWRILYLWDEEGGLIRVTDVGPRGKVRYCS